MSGAHLPTALEIDAWPDYTPERPMPLLLSACLQGVLCGADGSSYGAPYARLERLVGLANVRPIAFCPEDFSFGTPRAIADIHGGSGLDVLEGRARVLTDAGEDWTEGMLRAASAMTAIARHNQVRLAALMDISASCGSQVIYRNSRSDRVYQAGAGVAAAMLLREGITVVSQRDYRTLGRIVAKLDPTFEEDPEARDHHESDWYRSYFQ